MFRVGIEFSIKSSKWNAALLFDPDFQLKDIIENVASTLDRAAKNM